MRAARSQLWAAGWGLPWPPRAIVQAPAPTNARVPAEATAPAASLPAALLLEKHLSLETRLLAALVKQNWLKVLQLNRSQPIGFRLLNPATQRQALEV